MNNERLEATELRIANGRFHGGTELNESVEVDSGYIFMEAVAGHTRRRLAWNWLASALRLPQRRATVRDFRGAETRVATEPWLPISINGEVLSGTQVVARVGSGVIEVTAPA